MKSKEPNTTIKISKITKKELDNLSFVKKGWTYERIIIRLMEMIK